MKPWSTWKIILYITKYHDYYIYVYIHIFIYTPRIKRELWYHNKRGFTSNCRFCKKQSIIGFKILSSVAFGVIRVVVSIIIFFHFWNIKRNGFMCLIHPCILNKHWMTCTDNYLQVIKWHALFIHQGVSMSWKIISSFMSYSNTISTLNWSRLYLRRAII